MLAASVKGRAELREVQAKIVVEAPTQLRKDLLAGTRKAMAGLQPDVKKTAAVKLPHRGGYAALMAAALKVTTRVTGTSHITARASVSAKGKREARDVSALNRGLLRHPLYGNRRHWYRQKVRTGLVDDPIDRTRDRVVDMARKAAGEYAHTIAKG